MLQKQKLRRASLNSFFLLTDLLPEIVHQPEYLLPALEHFGDPFIQ